MLLEIDTGRIIDANKAAEAFYGFTRKEFMLMNITDVNIFAEHSLQKEFIIKGYSEISSSAVFKHRLKNGDIRTIEAKPSAIILNDKKYLFNIITDITEKIDYENALKESLRFFEKLTDNVIFGITIYNEKYVYVNPAGEQILGYAKEELYQKYVWDIYGDENVKKVIKSAIKTRLSGWMFNSTYPIKATTKGNVEKWLLIYTSTIKYKGEYAGLASFIDITELNNLRNSTERENIVLEIIMDNVSSVICIYKEKIIYMNPHGLETLNYSKKEISGLSLPDIVETRAKEKNVILESIKRRLGGENFTEKYTLKIRDKNGKVFWGEIVCATVFFQNEWSGLSIITDVSEKVNNEIKLLKEKNLFKELSELDGLTQIPNRRSFDEKLESYLNGKVPNNADFSLIMFDIDHFK